MSAICRSCYHVVSISAINLMKYLNSFLKVIILLAQFKTHFEYYSLSGKKCEHQIVSKQIYYPL